MKTQQCCVLTSALISVLLGIALVTTSCLVLDTDVVLRHLEPSFSPVVLALGIFVFISGAVGVAGSCIASRVMLAIYGFLELLAAATGLALGLSLVFQANMHSADIDQSCALFQKAGKGSSDLAKQYQASYDSMKQALQNCRRNGRPAALGLLECDRLGRDAGGRWFARDPQQELLSWTESVSGCGGFCSGDIPLFGFPTSDGNFVDQTSKLSGRRPCYKPLIGALTARGSSKGALIAALAAPLLAASCGSAWIICHPPPKFRKEYLQSDDPVESERLLTEGVWWGSSPDNSGSDEEYLS